MNSNPGIQNTALVTWTGSAAVIRDIRNHVRFGFVFEVTGAIAVDAVFNIIAAPPSGANPCNPGTTYVVKQIPICTPPITPAPNAQIVVPAGTPVGTICSVTLPCIPDAFVGVASVSGTIANVRIVTIMQGPMN